MGLLYLGVEESFFLLCSPGADGNLPKMIKRGILGLPYVNTGVGFQTVGNHFRIDLWSLTLAR